MQDPFGEVWTEVTVQKVWCCMEDGATTGGVVMMIGSAMGLPFHEAKRRLDRVEAPA